MSGKTSTWVKTKEPTKKYYEFKVSTEKVCQYKDCGKKYIATTRMQKYCDKKCWKLSQKSKVKLHFNLDID